MHMNSYYVNYSRYPTSCPMTHEFPLHVTPLTIADVVECIQYIYHVHLALYQTCQTNTFDTSNSYYPFISNRKGFTIDTLPSNSKSCVYRLDTQALVWTIRLQPIIWYMHVNMHTVLTESNETQANRITVSYIQPKVDQIES